MAIKIYSPKYYELREKIGEKHLVELYDRYFHAILDVFSRLGEKVTDYMCIFVGPAKIRNIPIPINEIIVEHLKEFGWKHITTFVDKIITRSMFKTQVNPATGIRENRIETEHLVVLRRN